MVRVLLVEDNSHDVLVTRRALAHHPDLRVHDVARLADARTHLAEHGADCVLLDLGLPDAGKTGTVEELLTVAPDVPVVVLTGDGHEAGAISAIRAGAQDYVIKGKADGPALVRAIRYAVARKGTAKELARRALHDELTGLANRALLNDRLLHALLRLERKAGCVAVLFCDLDGFKDVNDTFGHSAGDDVLVSVAARLRHGVRPTDTVARLGGDEFIVLCEDLSGTACGGQIAARLIDAIHAPFVVGGREVRVEMSVGVAFTTEAHVQPDDMLTAADDAMYRARRGGSGQIAHTELALA